MPRAVLTGVRRDAGILRLRLGRPAARRRMLRQPFFASRFLRPPVPRIRLPYPEGDALSDVRITQELIVTRMGYHFPASTLCHIPRTALATATGRSICGTCPVRG